MDSGLDGGGETDDERLADEEEEEEAQDLSLRALALKREEDAVFGKWPWRLFNRHVSIRDLFTTFASLTRPGYHLFRLILVAVITSVSGGGGMLNLCCVVVALMTRTTTNFNDIFSTFILYVPCLRYVLVLLGLFTGIVYCLTYVLGNQKLCILYGSGINIYSLGTKG